MANPVRHEAAYSIRIHAMCARTTIGARADKSTEPDRKTRSGSVVPVCLTYSIVSRVVEAVEVEVEVELFHRGMLRFAFLPPTLSFRLLPRL